MRFVELPVHARRRDARRAVPRPAAGRPVRLAVGAVAVLTTASVAPANPDRPPPAPAGTDVSLTTSDGVTIAATYYAPAAQRGPRGKAPAAILIHMYPGNRQSWTPLVPRLLDAGWAVLAYDIRGTGQSDKDRRLSRQYQDRDPLLFANAWHDAEAAAKWLAARSEVDATRLALVGASVGCSIALDYCARNEMVRAVVCLSPGTNYMSLKSLDHIRRCGKRPVLLCAPQAEQAACHELAKSAANAALEIQPGGRDLHGTKMFSAEYGAKLIDRIAAFLNQALADADAAPATQPAAPGSKSPTP